MAKNAKKPPIHNGKPITAFFARSSKGPPGSSQDASRTTTQSLAKSPSKADSENADNAMSLSQSSRIALKSPTKTASAVSPEAPGTPRHSENNSILKTPLISPVSKVSVKRSRSPELQVPQTSLAATVDGNLNGSRRFLERRKSKLDSEAEVAKSSNVINVYSTPNPKSKKRARLASEEPILSDLSDLVPSSQSDEEELTVIRNEAIPHVPTATMPVLPSPNDKHEDSSMEVDDVLGQQSSQSSDQITTPPPSGHIPVPSTPVALDAVSKTAKIIADIKAKAYAQAVSSPETTPLEFNDVSDSSSDEEVLLPILPTTTTVSSKSTSDSPPKGSSMATRRSTRNAAKHLSTSPMDGSRLQASSTRLASSGSTNGRIQTKKPSAADPFAALLKEKRMAQKNGNGSDAFNRAEIRTHSFGDLLEETVEDESDESTEPDEEDIALAIAQNSKLFDDDLVTNGSKVQDAASNDEDVPRKTLFGERSGRGIRDILEQDKALKKHDESSERNPGIAFWVPRQNAPETALVHDISSSYHQLQGSNALTRLFNTLLQHSEFSHAAILLNTNFIGSVEASERSFVASSLYDLAFSLPPSPASIAAGAVHALEEFWNSSIEPIESGLSFSRVSSTIQSLGADPSIFSSQGWPIVDVIQSEDITTFFREHRIQSLLILIGVCARSKRLLKGDIPDIILALLLIGMDNSTSPNLWREITATVNLICKYITDDASTSAQLETQVCLKLLKCVSTFEPVNKARAVYLLSTASGPTRRIANVVAYCIITDKESIDQEIFSEPPPLSDVIDQLLPYSRTSTLPPGKFALHEKTDYVNLGFYITILGVAVSNLRSYVVQERQLSAFRNSTAYSPRRSGEKFKTELQQLYASLETLHSNISDTRAMHLERSRTKANIKGLTMNIHYQREHWLRNLPDSRAKTLAEYFMKKSKS